MSNQIYDKYKEYDFSSAKHTGEAPHLAKLREELTGKSLITIRISNATLAAIKAKAGDKGYQTLINEALGDYVKGWSLAETVKQAVKEAMAEK